MKKIVATLILCSTAAFAVDVDKVVDRTFSTPGSVKPAFEKVDKNFAAVKTAVDAVTVTANAAQPADSDLTDLADGSLTGSKVGAGVPFASISGGLSSATVTVTRLVSSGTMTLDGRTPVVGYSTQPLVLDFFAGVTNGQVIAYTGGAYAAVPAVVVGYTHLTGAFAPTTNCYAHSKTISNCVVVCEEGLKVDVVITGARNY